MAIVGQHQVGLFPSPVRSAVPVDANRVRGNDNVLATAHNAHDADPTLHLVGVQTISTSQTLVLTYTHTAFIVDTSAGSVTLTLPPAADSVGVVFDVKKVSSSHTVTLDADGSELIDSATTLSWSTQHQSYRLVSDGTQWWVI